MNNDKHEDEDEDDKIYRLFLIGCLVFGIGILFLAIATKPDPHTYQCVTVEGSADILKCWPVDGTDELG